MEFIVKNELSSEENSQILDLFTKGCLAIYQHPNWIENSNNKHSQFVLLKENEVILFYTFIIESKFSRLPFIKTATSVFPYYANKESAVLGISRLIEYYYKQNYCLFTIQLYYCSIDEFGYIEQSLLKNEFNTKLSLARITNTSLSIDLKIEKEEILNNFSSLLKKNLRSAKNKNLYSKLLNTDLEFNEFNFLYEKMCDFKKIQKNKTFDVHKLLTFIKNNNSGFVIGVFTQDHTLIAGAVIITHLGRAEYLIGASDPDFKKLPSSHLALYDSIIKTKEMNMDYFDMGGYAFHAKNNSAYSTINDFKSNFTKQLVFYPKKIVISLNSVRNYIYLLILKLKRIERA